MIKKITAVFIAIMLLFPIGVHAITVITETEIDNDIITDIDARDEINDIGLMDEEYLEFEELFYESFDRIFEEFLQEMYAYIDLEVNSKETELLQIAEDSLKAAGYTVQEEKSTSNSMTDAQLGAGGGTGKKEVAANIGIAIKDTIKEEKNKEVTKEKEEKKSKFVDAAKIKVAQDKAEEKIKEYGSKAIDQYSKLIINEAFQPVYKQIRTRINDVVPVLGTAVTKVLKSYVGTLGLDEELGNMIRKQVGIEIKAKDPKETEFELGTELVNAAIGALETEGTKYARKYMNEFGKKVFQELGLDNQDSITLTHGVVNYVMVAFNGTLKDWGDATKDALLGIDHVDEYTEWLEEAGVAIDDYMFEYSKEQRQALEDKWASEQWNMGEELRDKYDRAREEAQEAMFNAIGQVAGRHAQEFADKLLDEVDDMCKDFGKLGVAVTKGLTNQIRSYVGRNVTQFVSQYLQNSFMGKNGSMKWERFEIDWAQLGVSVLTSFIDNQDVADMVDLAYGAVKGSGGFVSGPVNFEIYSKSYFVLTIRTGIEVTPTLSTSAIAAAISSGQANIAARR